MPIQDILGVIFAAIVGILLIIKGIMDVIEGTKELSEKGKNGFQRALWLIIGFPILVLAVIFVFVHDASPYLPLIAPTPTFSFPALFPTPTP